MKTHWLWDTSLSETRVKKILKNEDNPRFYIYAEMLFSRIKSPQIAFEYVSKEVFYRKWPLIKQRIQKDRWAADKAEFWQNIYDKLTNVSVERITIAQQIKDIRTEMGYTQEEMAKKLGVIQQFVSRLETGRENLTIDTLKRIAEVLGKRLTIQLN